MASKKGERKSAAVSFDEAQASRRNACFLDMARYLSDVEVRPCLPFSPSHFSSALSIPPFFNMRTIIHPMMDGPPLGLPWSSTLNTKIGIHSGAWKLHEGKRVG